MNIHRGAIHKRRRQLGGGCVKIGQNCRRIILKSADMGKGLSKVRKKCRRHLWMVPESEKIIKHVLSLSGLDFHHLNIACNRHLRSPGRNQNSDKLESKGHEEMKIEDCCLSSILCSNMCKLKVNDDQRIFIKVEI